MSDATFSAEERWQSLKAALLCGLATAIAAGIWLGLRRWQTLGITGIWASLGPNLSGLTFWVGCIIAGVSGGLFGLTYRYAVRRDQNPQLKAGVVLAFGLVRGLALVDTAAALAQGWPFLAAVLESLLLFAIAALILDWAMRRGWVSPFGGLADPSNQETGSGKPGNRSES